MAARPEAPAPEIVELSRIGAGVLDPLIEEEIRAWRTRLHWDFRPAADLIRRYVGMRALSGFALLAGSRPGRAICYLLLGVSVVSMAFALRNPWMSSWAHLLFRQFQWINY